MTVQRTEGRRKLALGVATVVGLALVAVAGWIWPEEASAIFTGVALVAAVLAVWYARPTYIDWRTQQRTPPVAVRLYIGQSNQGAMVDVTGRRDVQWFDEFVALRVEVANEGPATVRWGILDVAVPVDSTVEMVPQHDGYHVSAYPHPNDEVMPGKVLSVRLGYVERDFPPSHRYRYDAILRLREGECRVLAVLEGHPRVRAKAECTLHVSTKERSACG